MNCSQATIKQPANVLEVDVSPCRYYVDCFYLIAHLSTDHSIAPKLISPAFSTLELVTKMGEVAKNYYENITIEKSTLLAGCEDDFGRQERLSRLVTTLDKDDAIAFYEAKKPK